MFYNYLLYLLFILNHNFINQKSENMAQQQDVTTITIPCRFSYLNCFEPKAMKVGDPLRYSISALIPKTDVATINAIQRASEAALIAGITKKFGGIRPAQPKMPLRDGDLRAQEKPEDGDAYKGMVFISAHSTTRPGVVNEAMQPIISPDEIGSGDYGYINITFYPFSSNGNKGVAVSFNHIMKTKDGEKLAGRVSVNDAFGNILQGQPAPLGQPQFGQPAQFGQQGQPPVNQNGNFNGGASSLF